MSKTSNKKKQKSKKIATNTFNVSKEVNPHFKDVWTTNRAYNVLRGGRSSFKSSVVSMLLVRMMLDVISKGSKGNIVVIRKVANTIRDSTYLNIQWALEKFGVLDQFEKTLSPFKITHKKSGSTFHFYGADDFQKLKSNNIGHVIAVWTEEAAEFKNSEEFDQLNITFMRQQHPNLPRVYFFWTYNPPRNPFHWINDWCESIESNKDYLVHASTYKNDTLGFITQQMKDEIERIKSNDLDYYMYVYEGIPMGYGDNVYNFGLFQQIDEIPVNEKIMCIDIAADTGHSVSATTFGAYAFTNLGNVILLDTYYYSPAGKTNKKPPSQLAKDYFEFTKSVVDKWQARIDTETIDSAEGALRNQLYSDFNIIMKPVNKGKNVDMVEEVQDLLARGKVYVLKSSNNQIFLDEHKKYRWKDEKKKNGEKREKADDDPRVIKEDDHTCDQFKYLVRANRRKYGLQF